MPLTLEEKVDFIYRTVLKLAEKEKLLSLSQLWMAEGNLSQEDLGKAAQALSPIIQKIKNGESAGYGDIEAALIGIGFNKTNIKRVIGVLYADHQEAVGGILTKIGDLPVEIKMMIRKVKLS
jgi:hypothetical protein